MGHKYLQLSLEERCSIAQWFASGQSIQKIATTLDRSASTVSREVKRNCGKKVGYKPSYATNSPKRGVGVVHVWRGKLGSEILKGQEKIMHSRIMVEVQLETLNSTVGQTV
jgi:IS30 family transposase